MSAAPDLPAADRAGPARLVPSPVFVLSTMRSGSTLLRCLLDSHSRIRAPHELHLEGLQVEFGVPYTELAMDRLGLGRAELEFLLWDRVLHAELTSSGASVIVEKTPAHTMIWERISRCWPAARYLFLLRHPESVLSSLCELSPQLSRDGMAGAVAEHAGRLAAARQALPGETVRYEDLVAQPAATLRRLCRYLGVRWEPAMLDYGRFDHGPLEKFLGDFAGKAIRRPRQARPLPDSGRDHPALLDISRGWAY